MSSALRRLGYWFGCKVCQGGTGHEKDCPYYGDDPIDET